MTQPITLSQLTAPGPSPQRFWDNHQLRMRLGQLALDFTILAVSFLLAYLLRFEFDLSGTVKPLLIQLPYVMLIQSALLLFTGIYTFIWRYISLAEVHAFLYAALFSALPVLLLRLFLPDAWHDFRVPISVIVIDTGLAFGGLLGVRVLRRVLYERRQGPGARPEVAARPPLPVLLIGAGRTGVMVAREIQQRPQLGLEVRGFVDDDPHKLGLVVQGIKVLGTTQDLPRLIQKLAIDHLILTVVEASRREIRRILDICERLKVRVRIVPGLYEILGGDVAVSRIRDVLIEDLLGRAPVDLDPARLAAFFAGKRVLVTGAGGSIGSELARQIIAFGAAQLVLVDRSEGALFAIERELVARASKTAVFAQLADVADRARMDQLFARFKPQILFHAAAHKHVPMMEQNPSEAVKNNVLATQQLGELAGRAGVAAFVFVSTDKAVRPSSIMGASKRLAELVIQDLLPLYPETRFVAVRFGNVLGSTGSVVPIFREQIQAGGPLTVTHPEATRYFMTIPEAAQLVLEAGAIGNHGDILILDMGEPVRIIDLARDMITLSGLKPGEDIEIVFTGLRPGEKMHEDLLFVSEELNPTRHPKIRVVQRTSAPAVPLSTALARLAELAAAGSDEQIRHFLQEFLPEAQLLAAEPTSETVQAAPPSGHPPTVVAP